MKLRTLLLDVDGTLVDSNDKHTDCWVEAFAHFGKQVEWDTVRQQIGKGGDLLVPDTLNALEMRRFGSEVQKFRGELWKRDYMESVKPFPGIRESLETLHRRGLVLVLASSANPEEVDYYVGLLGIETLIEGSTSKGDAEVSKPSPEIFEAALDRVKADAVTSLVVGDTPYDVLAAHRVPVAVAAVRSGKFDPSLLAKAEFLFDDVNEMTARIDEIDEYFAKANG
ncbi:MAG: HAD family hydrolase [Thermoanaerobaculia bacterium]